MSSVNPNPTGAASGYQEQAHFNQGPGAGPNPTGVGSGSGAPGSGGVTGGYNTRSSAAGGNSASDFSGATGSAQATGPGGVNNNPTMGEKAGNLVDKATGGRTEVGDGTQTRPQNQSYGNNASGPGGYNSGTTGGVGGTSGGYNSGTTGGIGGTSGGYGSNTSGPTGTTGGIGGTSGGYGSNTSGPTGTTGGIGSQSHSHSHSGPGAHSTTGSHTAGPQAGAVGGADPKLTGSGKDSTTGKLMEKLGGAVGNDEWVAKGAEKRRDA